MKHSTATRHHPFASGVSRFSLRSAIAISMLATALSPATYAAGIEDSILELQHDWEAIRYQSPPAEREKRFEVLVAKAHKVSSSFAGRSEPLVWEGIIVSSLAGAKGGIGALGLVKQAKALYEDALKIDANVLDAPSLKTVRINGNWKPPASPAGNIVR